jgi:hypothetical protein
MVWKKSSTFPLDYKSSTFSTLAGINNVATLASGSQSRQGLTKMQTKSESGSHISCSQECRRVWRSEPPHSQRNSHFVKLKSQWTPESSKGNFRGQNSLDWANPYITKNLLEYRCLKWVSMTHLDIWNTSYGQKKGQESNRQFDSRPLKVKNLPDSLAFRWRATYRCKALDKG